MSSMRFAVAEIFTVRDVARAAEVSVRAVRTLVDSGQLSTVDGTYLAGTQAVRAVRLLRAQRAPSARDLFAPPVPGEHAPGKGLLAASAVHAALLAGLVLITTLGLTSPSAEVPQRLSPTRLVFLATPGPGGGGGGGGLRQQAPPARARMKSASPLRSPVPPPKPLTTRQPDPAPPRLVPPRPVSPAVSRPVDPPPPAPRPAVIPQVVAPVVMASSDSRDQAGLPVDVAPDSDSQGNGSGGGAGTGQGTGLGGGTGAGIGPGSGGGTGGGPYRPGSGITAPEILREVKPEYTEEARRRGIEGDVVMEIVVRKDGSVGDVKVRQGLGGGLDRRAIDAVRQWRFAPATRRGAAVDVMVEVAVEFKLR
ncbi:MAG TPA: energy transducer TonB [Vicinamibacterales bacterium]|nr:energy transducer TonB [Vicinamibacterales bacterium]